MDDEKMEVRFDIYCEKCKYAELNETWNPCNECLAQPWNENSQKPINYVEGK